MSCPYCHSIGGGSYPIRDIFGNTRKLVHCRECGVAYPFPAPSPQELMTAYDDSYYGKSERKFAEPFESMIQWFRQSRARRIHRLLSGKGNVLDVGCGNGQFLEQLGRLGDYQLSGVESGPKAIERVKKIPSINLLSGSFPKVPEEGKYDAVTLYHVFEHLHDPLEALEAIDRLCKRQGVVEISIPNIDSWQAHLFRGRWLHHDPPRHIFHMPPALLVKNMAARGFKLTSARYFSLEQNPFGAIQSILNFVISDRDILFERLKGNNEYASNHGALSVTIQKSFMLISMPVFIVVDMIASLFRRSATVRLTFKKLL